MPTVKVSADEMTAVALKLAKAGFYGGDPEKVLEARADLVLAALQYVKFLDEYETTLVEINKEGAR